MEFKLSISGMDQSEVKINLVEGGSGQTIMIGGRVYGIKSSDEELDEELIKQIVSVLGESKKTSAQELAGLMKQISNVTNVTIVTKVHEVGLNTLTATRSAPELVVGAKGRELDARIEEEVKKFGFSGSICIVENGQTVLQKGYGPATESQEVSPATTFRIASLTKTLVAAAIMKLHDEGLDLHSNAPLKKYFAKAIQSAQEEIETLKEQPSNSTNKARFEALRAQIDRLGSITIGQLLSHTSGLGRSDALYESLGKNYVVTNHHEPAELIDTFLKKTLVAEPESEKVYSNIGYLLLGLVISDFSGKPFQAFMEDLFQGLGMNGSRCPVNRTEDTPEAQGFNIDKTGSVRTTDTNLDDCSFRLASGNLISSAVDLVRLEEALRQPKTAGGLLSAESLQEMRGHGYGWDRYGKDVEELILGTGSSDATGERGWGLKDGEMDGSHAMLISLPDIDSTIIMLGNTNTHNGAQGNLGMLCVDVAKMLVAD